jgi:hypothetical protein
VCPDRDLRGSAVNAPECICPKPLWRDRFHTAIDCMARYEAFIEGDAVDGYEIGVSDESDLMEGRVVRRHDVTVMNLRKARMIAERMLREERKRHQTKLSERIT